MKKTRILDSFDKAVLIINDEVKLPLGIDSYRLVQKDMGPLPDLPPRDECSLCMRVLPIPAIFQPYYACCGKIVCCGCSFQHEIKSGELAAERGQALAAPTCPFCRTSVPRSDEEMLARLRTRIELKDPHS